MITLEPYINFITENNLTQEQFLLLHLMYSERRDLIAKYKKAFPNDEGTMISNYQIQDLIKREYLVRSKNGVKIGEKFLRIFVDSIRATDEVYDLYPAFTNVNGVEVPLITMDRKIFADIYMNKINGSYDEHKEVIKDIRYGIENHLIKTGLNKFLTSEQWKILRKLRVPVPTGETATHTDPLENEFE